MLRGGQGNYRLLSFDHTKNMSLMAQLPLVDLKFVGLLTGKDMSEGAVDVPIREVLSSTSNTLTLSQTPTTGTLKIYKLDQNITQDRNYGDALTESGTPTTDEYDITGTSATLGGTVSDGTTYACVYEYSAPSTTKTITFTADNFAKYLRITGEGIVTDQVTGAEEIVKFDFKKVKPQNNFTVTMASTEFTVLDITFDLFAVDENNEKVYLTMHELAT